MSLEGQQLGRYRFQRLLGSGGMGEVYLATDTIINRQVAIKVIRANVAPYPDANATQEAARLFQREMKAIAALDHPHILPLYDYGESRVNDETLTYMVMPYRPEGSLTSWLQRRGRAEPLSPQEVASLVDQAASALQHAHNRQVIHQDVKPANFLIQSDEEYLSRPNLLLADFGVAKFSSSTSSASQTVRGTPTSMAPEQWEGHPVPATDQYALAVMAYELLTGRPPFQGGLSQVMYQHFNTPPPPPSFFNPRIPGEIDAVLLRALAKRPDERFPSISAFARAFQEAVQHASAASAPAPWTGPDIRATLAISTTEALSGASRTLTLPGGRSVTVPVPAGAYDGQVIRLEGQGEPTSGGGPAGALVLTLAVRQPEEVKGLSDAGFVEKTAYASYPNLPPTIVPASDPHLQQPLTPPPPPGFEPLPPVVLARTPSAYEPAIQASNPYLPPAVASTSSPAGGIRPGLAPARPGSGAPGPSGPKGRVILLIGLALLIIAGSVGLYSVIHANQVATATAHAHATATAAAFSATGTAQSQSIAATADAFNATATPQAQATGTATAYQNLYNSATSGTPALSDPLSDNSNGNGWSEGTSSNFACAFAGGAYHASESQKNSFVYCDAPSTDFRDFAFQVQMKIIKGDDGGVIFRANDTNNTYYVFSVGQDGSYELFVCPPKAAKCNSALLSNSSGAINQGLNQTNVVTVVVKGNTITLYVNQQEIDSVTDNTFSHGQVGVIAYDISNPTEVAYNKAKVWKL
jgi:eukaryotic-like serine/threonine-protein kinase